MAVNTNNYYGTISIADEAIASVVGFTVLDCYGVVELASRNLKDSFAELFKRRPYSRGVKITNFENRIFVDVDCILKFGVSISAVVDSMKKAIKYNLENFTGMIVDTINVHVAGIRV